METTTLEALHNRGALDSMLEDTPAPSRTDVLDTYRTVLARVRPIATAIQETQGSADLTVTGRENALRQLDARADTERTAIAEIEQRRLGSVDRDLAHLTTRALRGVVRDGTGWKDRVDLEMTPERVSLHREIRDRLMTLREHEREELYLAAFLSGDDEDLVAAVDRAPKAFPIVNTTTETIRRRKLDASPLAPAIAAQQALRATYEYIFFSARRDLQV